MVALLRGDRDLGSSFFFVLEDMGIYVYNDGMSVDSLIPSINIKISIGLMCNGHNLAQQNFLLLLWRKLKKLVLSTE